MCAQRVDLLHFGYQGTRPGDKRGLRTGVLAGAREGRIIDHALSLGVGGYYLVNNVPADAPGSCNDPYVNFYSGGLDVELVIASYLFPHCIPTRGPVLF
jgi:hypothetical protein